MDKKTAAPEKFSGNVRWIFLVTILGYGTWGIVDPIYSIFLSEIFDKNYFLVGLAFGVRSFVSIISVFFLARLLKRITAPQGLFFSQIIASIGAFGFFLADMLSSPALVFVICAINGISVILQQTAKQSFLMKESNASNASRILGTNVGLKYSFWGVGMVIGALLFYFFGENIQLRCLYVGIGVVLLLQLIIYKNFFKHFKSIKKDDIKDDISTVITRDKIFFHLFAKMKNFSSPLNFSILLFFFMEMTARVVMLFIPLLALDLDLKIWQVFLLMAFMMMPMLFTFIFSKWADKYDRFHMIIGGILLSLVPLIFLMILENTLYIAVSSAVISVCLAFLQPAVLGVSGSLAPEEEKTSIAELELFFASLGAIVGSMGVGAVASAFGIQAAFGVITFFAVLFLTIALWVQHHVKKHSTDEEHNTPKHHHRKIYEITHFHFRRHFG